MCWPTGMDISDVALRNAWCCTWRIALSRVRAGNAMLSGTDESAGSSPNGNWPSRGACCTRTGERPASPSPSLNAPTSRSTAGKRILRDARAARHSASTRTRELVDEMLKVADFNYNLGLGNDDDLQFAHPARGAHARAGAVLDVALPTRSWRG